MDRRLSSFVLERGGIVDQNSVLSDRLEIREF